MEKLIKIQTELKAPKNQHNSFGGYNYRSCEDILEAVKPLLKEAGCMLTIRDEIVEVAGRVYVKATARIHWEGDEKTHEYLHHETTAYAREPESRKGMDASQITGASSSYARKYALAGLFLLDDAASQDPDATNTHGKTKSEKDETKDRPPNGNNEQGWEPEDDIPF